MTTIRRFGRATRQPVPRPGVANLYASMIQISSHQRDALGEAAMAQRFNGLPIVLDYPTTVVALTLEPHGHIDEHDAPHPILFMVIEGSGFLRIGGPDAPTTPISAGDAVLWPPHVLRLVWTEESPLRAIVIEYPPHP